MKIDIILYFVLLVSRIYTGLAAVDHGTEEHPDFSHYVDCETGAKTYPFCSANDESPIDIKRHGFNTDFDDDDVCTEGPLQWNYIPSETSHVWLNDHTVSVGHSDADGNAIDHLDATQKKIGAWFANPWNDEATESTHAVEDYCLRDLHFHWGLTDDKGSEHTLDGRAFPMEGHFVHFNCQGKSVTEIQAKYADMSAIERAKAIHEDYHELAVIGVWFVISATDNPVMEKILNAVEGIGTCQCDEEDEQCYRDSSGDIQTLEGHFVPKDGTCEATKLDHIDLRPLVDTSDGYYSYEGSLTTPPCTDDVRWFMLRKYAGISKRQMERMRAIKKPCTDELMAPNFREVQDNKNTQYSCDAYDGKYNQCRMNLKQAIDNYNRLWGYLLNMPERRKHGRRGDGESGDGDKDYDYDSQEDDHND